MVYLSEERAKRSTLRVSILSNFSRLEKCFMIFLKWDDCFVLGKRGF